MALIVDDLVGPIYHYEMPLGNIALCDLAVLSFAFFLLVANIATFDRRMGRMPEGRTLPEPEVLEDWPPRGTPHLRRKPEAGRTVRGRPPSFS